MLMEYALWQRNSNDFDGEIQSETYLSQGQLRELSGLDAVKMSWTPDIRHSVSFAYIGS